MLRVDLSARWMSERRLHPRLRGFESGEGHLTLPNARGSPLLVFCISECGGACFSGMPLCRWSCRASGMSRIVKCGSTYPIAPQLLGLVYGVVRCLDESAGVGDTPIAGG